jgi:hypothetical protein
VKKKKQRVHWRSVFTCPLVASRQDSVAGGSTFADLLNITYGIPEIAKRTTPPSELFRPASSGYFITGAGTPATPSTPSAANTIQGTVFPSTVEVEVKRGSATVAVDWNVIVTAKKKLIKPALDGCTLIETKWD